MTCFHTIGNGEDLSFDEGLMQNLICSNVKHSSQTLVFKCVLHRAQALLRHLASSVQNTAYK